MNLSKTDLPASVITTLRGMNVREVESLLSMLATPHGLTAIARVLKMPIDAVQKLAPGLHSRYPEIEVTVASPGSTPYAMGHHPPPNNNKPGRHS